MKKMYFTHINILFDFPERGGEGSKNRTVDKTIEKNYSANIVLVLLNEPDKNKWKGILNDMEANVKSVVGSKYNTSGFSGQVRSLRMQLFDTSGNIKPDADEGLMRFIKSYGIENSDIKESRDLTANEEKQAKGFILEFLQGKVREGKPLTRFGNARENIFGELKSTLEKTYPNLPKKRIEIMLSSIQASIENERELFGGTRIKKITYDGLNTLLEKFPGARQVQEYVGSELKKRGANGKIPTDNEKIKMVGDIFDGIPGNYLLGKELEGTIKEFIHAFADIYYDAQAVTLNGGKFQNTAENSLINIVNSASSKEVKLTKVSATGNVTKKNTTDVFKNGISDISYKELSSIMGAIKNPIEFLKKEIGPEKYREFCLYVASKGFVTRLFTELNGETKEQIQKDATEFEINFRKKLGNSSTIPEGFSIPNVPKETLESYYKNPSLQNLANIIKLSGVGESSVNKLLGDIQKASNEQAKKDLTLLGKYDKKFLQTKVSVNGLEKSYGTLTNDEIRFLMSTNTELPKDVLEYFTLRLSHERNRKVESSTANVQSNPKGSKLLYTVAQGKTLTKTEKENFDVLENQNTHIVNIASSKSNIEVLSTINNLPAGIDYSDPGKVIEALKSGNLSLEQVMALKSINGSHREISEQIESYTKKYGENATKEMLKSALIKDGKVIGTETSEVIFGTYQYLEKNIYHTSSDQDKALVMKLVSTMQPGDREVLIESGTGENGESIGYKISANSKFEREIKDLHGNTILSNVPFNSVVSALDQISLTASLGLSGLAKYLPTINTSIRGHGSYIDSFDTTFDSREYEIYITTLIDLVGFPKAPEDISKNGPALLKYFHSQKRNLPHSFMFQCQSIGLFDNDGNIVPSFLEKRLKNRGQKPLISPEISEK